MKTIKTNAMRILDKAKIPYEVQSYAHGKEAVDGLHVASMLNQDPNAVCKTLVTISNTKEYFVFVIPVAYELDLKKCAKAVGVKHIEMIPMKDINNVSGYVRGGCSPIGMKKNYVTTMDETCLTYDTILVSGGKIGIQIALATEALYRLLNANKADIIV